MSRKIMLMAATATLIVLGACNKKEDNTEKFSPQTIEENKANLEETGVKMVNELDQLSKVTAIDVAINFGGLLDSDDPLDDSGSAMSATKVGKTLEAIAGLKSNPTSFKNVMNTMKAAEELAEEPETLQEVWDLVVGVYDWNASTEIWEYSENADAVIFNFPSSEMGTSNDAQLKISEYKSVVVTLPMDMDQEYTGDIPTSLKVSLTVGGNEVMSYVFAAEYNEDGIPSKIASDLTLDKFVFSVDGTNNTSEISASGKITHDGSTLIELTAGTKGNFSEENIDKNMITHTETYTWTDYVYNPMTQQYETILRTEVDEWVELDYEEVFNTAFGKFQIMDVAIKGDFDIKAFGDSEDEVYANEDDEEFDWDAADSLMVGSINDNLNLRLVYVDNNEIIAKLEAYIVHETDEWGTWSYIDFRLLFGDDQSPVDFDTYFGSGFSEVEQAFSDLIADIEAEYGS